MIQSEVRDGIVLLRFDRPPANAIELESATALETTLSRLEADGNVRAVVLTGRGAFFSAGLDLKLVPTYSATEQRSMIAAINRMVARIYGLALPVVIAVNGHAIAGGLVVALAGDYRIGSHGTYRLGLTETRVAIPYPAAPMAVVQAELAPAVARRWVLLARNAAPEDALADGVLDELQPAEALLPRALAMAEELAQLPRAAYGRIKRQLRGPTLARIEAVINGEDPLVRTWISAETAPAAADVLARTRPS